MNRIILSLLLTTTFAAPAIAQNCVNSSRCDELGYVKTATDCKDLDTLVCPFDKNKVFCSSPFHDKSCEVGDTLYSDKKCYSIVPTEAIAIGVVFDAENRLAVALTESYSTWGGAGKEIGASARGKSGKYNTSAILTYGKSNNILYPAAFGCFNAKTDGTKAGDWFLPSSEELELVMNKLDEFNIILEFLGKDKIKDVSNIYYCSFTERNANGADRRAMYINSYGSKIENNYVRCVLAF